MKENNIKSSLEQVSEFHKMFEHPIANLGDTEPLKIRQLRVKLLFEELGELAEAGDVMGTLCDLCENIVHNQFDENSAGYQDGNNVNQVEELDALADIQYVLDGKFLTSGLHSLKDKAVELVHQNNITKAHRNAEHVQTTSLHLGRVLTAVEKDGSFLAYNSDGKLTKPWDHKKVSLETLFVNHAV